MKFSPANLLTVKNSILVASLLANIALLLACLFIVEKTRKVYTDYRHFRSLPVGVSEASSASLADNAVVLFGDSRVETWAPLPELPGKTVVNAGVTGETTSEMRRRFESDVLRLKPETVLIQAGMNDLTASVTRDIPAPQLLLDRMFDNLEYFVFTLRDAGANVILTPVIPNKDLNPVRKIFWHPTLQASVADTNRKLKLMAEKYNAHWLDISPIFFDDNNRVRAELYKDTLHVKAPAYVQVNKQVEALF